ncbi:hypothetical protein BA904_29170 [Klebsiella pneumoniae]|nr:hypothetical protein BA904_29170 [Klebsiella pneumoniae]
MSTVTISDTPFVGNDRLLVGIVLSVLTFWLFAQSVINVVPAMISSLDISLETLTLAVSLSALFSGCFVVASGGLADKFGRMRMTTIGLGLSIVGSAMLVVAQGPGLFLAGRVLQGLSAACIMPATLALIKTWYEGRARQRAVSFWVIGSWGGSGLCSMVVMAQEYGADVRLVALMQYLRVLFVVGAAALVVRYALGNEAQEMTQDIVWFPSLTLNFPFTLLLTAVACWLGMRLRIPSGAMLLPMLLGALAQGGGWLMLELPEWLLAMAYAVLGWTVGLQFNKAIFLLALKTLPQIIASIIGLILMCALMALALTHILQMDFMTAYLATSPGGLDTVAIIAAGTRADMSFIMALQTLRLFTILLTGPAMARAISRYAPRQ